MSKVRKYCSGELVTAQSGESLQRVAQRMRDEHVGCVVVIEGLDGKRKLLGILTDRDIVVRALAQTGRYLEQVSVGDVMSHAGVTVSAEAEMGEALKIMRAAGIRRLPVIEPTGELVGLLSLDDALDYLQEVFGDLTSTLSREQRNEAKAQASHSRRE
jgi:CBS domain-containing protein